MKKNEALNALISVSEFVKQISEYNNDMLCATIMDMLDTIGNVITSMNINDGNSNN